jgi:hypothetical protein
VVDHRGVRLLRDVDGVWTWISALSNKSLDIRWFFWRLSEHDIGLLSDARIGPTIQVNILRRAIDGLFEDNEIAERRRMRRAA